MDRGRVSEENVEFLKQGGRRYIVGTPKSMLSAMNKQLLAQDWRPVHEGLEVRLCPAPHPSDEDLSLGAPAPDGAEVFILCRSAQRRQKEQAMHARFEKRIAGVPTDRSSSVGWIEEGLRKIEAGAGNASRTRWPLPSAWAACWATTPVLPDCFRSKPIAMARPACVGAARNSGAIGRG